MSGAGIGAFINGIFEGKDWKDRKNDRKRRQKREDISDKMSTERHDWDRENQDWRREDAVDARTERGRVRREEAEDRDFWDGLSEGYPDGSAAPDQVAPNRAAESGVIQQRSSKMDAGLAELSEMSRHPAAVGLGNVAVPDQSAPVTAQNAPSAQSAPVEIRPSMMDARPAQQGLPPVMPENSPRPAGNSGRIAYDAESVGASPEIIKRAMGADQLSEVLRSNINPDTGQPLTGQDRAEIAASIKAVEEQIVAVGSGTEGGMPNPQQVPPEPKIDQAQVLSDGLSGLSQLSRPERPAAGGLAVGNVSQAGQTSGQPSEVTQEGTPTPSVDSVTLTAPVKMGVRGEPERPNSNQVRRAQKDFFDHYMAKSAPKIVKHYLSRGEIDKARDFQAFIKSSGVKKGMAAWARAAHAAAVGDERGFIEGIEGAYNEAGYYDDGYTMVKGKSGLVSDDKGRVTGAQIVFKDEQTGEEFTQEFNSTEDLYGLGLKMLAPEEVFERGYADVQAANKFRRNMQANLATAQVPGAQRELFMKVGEYLAKNDDNFADLTPDEQFTRILGFINQTNGSPASQRGVSAQLPVLR